MSFQAAPASTIESVVHGEYRLAMEKKLDARLCDLLDRRCKEFCDSVEERLNIAYDQTAVRLGALSDQIVRKFCESLSQQAAATLNALVAASAQQNKANLDAESQDALKRFSQQANGLSLAHLDTHRKEVQNLASDLQGRLRRVAYALEEVGSTAPRS
ncbi:MAG TPA: hypothetical protein VNF02_07240 [Candidatus Limnocylindrales bacterium]|nr:hypothetical protein [Candidatus Limnocylindrales bacterium]